MSPACTAVTTFRSPPSHHHDDPLWAILRGPAMPATNGIHYDPLETRDPEQRDTELLAALPGLLRHAVERAPAYARHLAGTDPDGIASFAALAALPVLRKEELH